MRADNKNAARKLRPVPPPSNPAPREQHLNPFAGLMV